MTMNYKLFVSAQIPANYELMQENAILHPTRRQYGALVRNKHTGVYAMLIAANLVSVPQDWARNALKSFETTPKYDYNVLLLREGDMYDTDRGEWFDTEAAALEYARGLSMQDGETVQIVRVDPKSGDVDEYCYELHRVSGSIEEYFNGRRCWL